MVTLPLMPEVVTCAIADEIIIMAVAIRKRIFFCITLSGISKNNYLFFAILPYYINRLQI
jgi:hypothetical protein